VDKNMEFGGIWNTYVELSTTAFENGHYDVAETMLRAAYRQAPRDADGGHTRMAIVLENLAEVFVKQQRYGKAERVYRRALGMNDRARGRGTRNAARVCFKLAHLCLLSERMSMFDKWYQKAMEICKVSTDIPLEEQATHMLKLVQYLHKHNNRELGWTIYKQLLSMRQDMQPPGAAEAVVNAAKMIVPSNVNL
jgi:tetratricopeptide (TPR) repeat protein